MDPNQAADSAAPPSPTAGAPASVNLGPELTDARARIETLGRENSKLQTQLEASQAEVLTQKEEVARLQGLLTQVSKSQLPELGEGAFELGEGATILAALTADAEPGRTHALAGDVLTVGLKAPQLAKLKEKLKGKARCFVVDKSTLDELRDLKLLRN